MLTGAPLARGSAPAFRALAPEPSNPSDRDQAKTAPKIRHSLKGQLYKQQRDKCLEGNIRIITKEREEIIKTTRSAVFRGRLIALFVLFIWPLACPQTPGLGFEPLSEIEGLRRLKTDIREIIWVERMINGIRLENIAQTVLNIPQVLLQHEQMPPMNTNLGAELWQHLFAKFPYIAIPPVGQVLAINLVFCHLDLSVMS